MNGYCVVPILINVSILLLGRVQEMGSVHLLIALFMEVNEALK